MICAEDGDDEGVAELLIVRIIVSEDEKRKLGYYFSR